MKIHLSQPYSKTFGKHVFSVMMALLFFFNFNMAMAQPQNRENGKREKIEELRKKFINEKLALTESEQKVFWPLYNEYKLKEKALRDSFRNHYKPNDVVFMDDKQSEAFLNATFKLSDDQNSLFKDYMTRFKKVLPIKKVAMLPMVEKEFKREMLEKMRMHQNAGGRKGPPDGTGPDDE